MSKKWILCMFSGGLDSTGALYRLLTEPEYKEYDIHVHSMTLINFEGRDVREHIASGQCVRWFEANCRDFKFTRSSHDYRSMGNNFIWDADLVMFMGGQISSCAPENYSHICFGATKTDIDNPQFSQGVRMERAYAIRDAVYTGSYKNVPDKLYPVAEFTKKEIWDMLPEDLRKHTWSCRTPIKGVPCGVCVTCEDMKDIG